jgi:hypothetical protein
MVSQIKCLINGQGELLEILQEGQEKEVQEGQFLVSLSNYYDVLNLERYPNAIWDFELKMWIGIGEQRPVVVPMPSEMDILQAKLNSATEQLDFQEELIVELAMMVYQ